MVSPRQILPLLVCVLSSASLNAAELPPRALAQIGSHRFYHGPGVRCAVLSPDGRRIASAAGYSSYFNRLSEDVRKAHQGVIILWDATTGERIREIPLPHEPVRELAFSPDGKRILACMWISAEKNCTAVFEAETGKIIKQFEKLKGYVWHLHFASGGKQILVSEGSDALASYEVATGKRLRLWNAPTALPDLIKANESLAGGILSPEGKFIAWQVWEKPDNSKRPLGGGLTIPRPIAVIVADGTTEKPLYRKEFARYSWNQFAFSPDSRQFMTLSDKFSAWETATSKELFALTARPAWRFALSPDGRHAVLADRESRVRLWDLDARKPSHEVCAGLSYINEDLLNSPQVFSGDGKTLLLATDSTLRLFDTSTGKERGAAGHRSFITPRFSSDGRTLFTTCDETRRRWDVSAGKASVLLTHQARHAWEGIHGQVPSHEGQILAHSADGSLFLHAVGSDVHVRETATGRVRRELQRDRWAVATVLFSPDATQGLILRHQRGAGRLGQLCSTTTGKMSGEFTLANSAGQDVFSPNGRLVASLDRTSAVHLHDGVTGHLERTLQSSSPLPEAEFLDSILLFSANGEYLVVMPRPFEVRLTPDRFEALPTCVFDMASGKEISRFHAHPKSEGKDGEFSCGACSPDGRLLAVAEAGSGAIRLIEIASGKVRAELAGHRHGVHALAFAPDGKALASGGHDNVVFVWDVTGARTAAALKKAGEKELASWWANLAAEDAGRAGEVIVSLIRTPEQTAAFLKVHLRPARTLDSQRLAQLLTDLNGKGFATRDAASRELARLGPQVETPLRRALKEADTLEMKRRLEGLLEKLERCELPPETLRELRAVEALEHLGTPAARQLLEDLGNGASGSRITQEAKAALARLARRS